MKLSRIIIPLLMLLTASSGMAQRKVDAERAWKPFFTEFGVAVRKHDREILKKMMARDFFTSGGVGDDNHDGDSRDETFEYWNEVRGWDALDKILSQGTVPMAAWRNKGAQRKYVSRIAPPAANIRKNIKRASGEWYAVFEFRNGHWYCTTFAQCCD